MMVEVAYYCAFEDGDGWFIDKDEPYESEDDAITMASIRNAQEQARVKGSPDAVWVVMKSRTTLSVVADSVPHHMRKRRIVKRKK